MKHAHSGVRRSVGSLAALALVAGATAVLATSVEATPASAAAADQPVAINDATLTWGLNGYSQVGILGPWTYKDLSGNVTQLVGSVSGGSQTEYLVDPVPATSMPVSSPQKTPNAVKFTAGTGTADPATGESTLVWDGSYTVNAYPAQYNAPNEIYSDPQLTTAADGSGTLTMNFALGEGIDMAGNPAPAEDFGRITLATFDAGSSAPITGNPDAFRLTPDYQGVEVTIPEGGGAQTRTCAADGGNTGWWGSWPQEFISDIPASVRPHFYSTGCGGNQNYKPALPLDIDLNSAPSVTVSKSTVLASGVQQVTVKGTGFDPTLAIGTRPPFMNQPSGAYVVFGKFPDTWRPSQGVASSARKIAQQLWALPSPQNENPSVAASAVLLKADGTFTATLNVDQNAAALSGAPGNFGIYTFAGGGATVASFETYTPITFADTAATLVVNTPAVTYGEDQNLDVAVTGAGTPTGTVVVRDSEGVRVGQAQVTAGQARVRLRKPSAGTRDLTVLYSGNATNAGSEAVTTATVAKALPTVTVAAQDVTAGQPVEVTVELPTAATGSVTLAEGGTALGEADLVDGKATVTVADLAVGTHTLVASYAGDTNHEAAEGSKVVTVAAAPVQPTPTPTATPTTTPTPGTADEPVEGKAKVTWGSKPTVGRRGTAVVKVSDLATGKVTAVLRNAAGKKVGKKLKTITARIKDGAVKVKLPKLGKGTYALVVKVPGNDDVAKARVTRTFRVK